MNNKEMLEIINREKQGVFCIGNGQLHDALVPEYEVSKTLNCLDDVMKILVIKGDDNEQSNNIL